MKGPDVTATETEDALGVPTATLATRQRKRRSPIANPAAQGTRREDSRDAQYARGDTWAHTRTQRPDPSGRYVLRKRSKDFEGTMRPPAKTQPIFKVQIRKCPLTSVNIEDSASTIIHKSLSTPAKRDPRSTPQVTLSLSDRSQNTCLQITSCPWCNDFYVLSYRSRKNISVACKNCGNMSLDKISTAQGRQLAMIRTEIENLTDNGKKQTATDKRRTKPTRDERSTRDVNLRDECPE